MPALVPYFLFNFISIIRIQQETFKTCYILYLINKEICQSATSFMFASISASN